MSKWLDLVDRAGSTFVFGATGYLAAQNVTASPLGQVFIGAAAAGLQSVLKWAGVSAHDARLAEAGLKLVEALPAVQKAAQDSPVVRTSEQVADQVAEGLMK